MSSAESPPFVDGSPWMTGRERGLTASVTGGVGSRSTTRRSLTIPEWAQGRPGMGQGGFSAHHFARLIGEPVDINFRAPIPLGTALGLEPTDGGWALLDDERLIMDAVRRDGHVDIGATEPVTVEQARHARRDFWADGVVHDAPHCFSCGTFEGSMTVQPGLLHDGSGRFATDWTAPRWAGDGSGRVDHAAIWTALDCSQGFYISRHPEHARPALTVRYTAEVLRDVGVEEPLVVVAFDGGWTEGWDGKKRGAGACLFDSEGALLARSTSLWVAIEE